MNYPFGNTPTCFTTDGIRPRVTVISRIIKAHPPINASYLLSVHPKSCQLLLIRFKSMILDAIRLESETAPACMVRLNEVERDLFSLGINASISDVIEMLDAAKTIPNRKVRVPMVIMTGRGQRSRIKNPLRISA